MARLGVRILICLALGAITTMTVAVAIVIGMHQGWFGRGHNEIRILVTSSSVPVRIAVYDRVGSRSTYASIQIRPESDEFERVENFPLWFSQTGRDWISTSPPEDCYANVSMRMYGFPFSCLNDETRSWAERNTGCIVRYRKIERTPKWTIPGDWLAFLRRFDTGQTSQVQIPLKISPLQFAGNATVYSGAWFLAIAAPGAFKRRRRRRRGLCVKCGYDLQGINDTCPECGCASASLVIDQ